MESSGRSVRLALPIEDAERWAEIEAKLRRPLAMLSDLDALLTELAAETTKQRSKFFSTIPGSPEASKFDFNAFWMHGLPLVLTLALETCMFFPAGVEVPLLLDPRFTRGRTLERGYDEGTRKQTVTLTRRQAACLLAHSFLGTITAASHEVGKEKFAFRASQLFFLESLPAAFALLTYFTTLGQHGFPEGGLTYERLVFDRKAGPPWSWKGNSRKLCPVRFALTDAERMEDSPAQLHADFANRFVGGGCLENDKQQEEILFAMKPELIVAMALTTYLQDEEVLRVHGALQFSEYSGYGSSFEFEGCYCGTRAARGPAPGAATAATAPGGGDAPPSILAMDALQFAKTVFTSEGLMLRDVNKARLGFAGFSSIATGNWGCGAFGNDHLLKFLQQWMAASDVCVVDLHYHTYGDPRAANLPSFAAALQNLTVGELWEKIWAAADGCTPPTGAARFRKQMEAALGLRT